MLVICFICGKQDGIYIMSAYKQLLHLVNLFQLVIELASGNNGCVEMLSDCGNKLVKTFSVQANLTTAFPILL